MRSSKGLWRTVGLVSLAATLVLLFGFGYAVNDLLNPSGSAVDRTQGNGPEQAPFASTKEFRITALGDSLTKGTGDETGEGFVRQVAAMLKDKTGKQTTIVNNLAITGLRADQLTDKLASDKGYTYALRQANLILLTIGGNDLFQFAQTGGAGDGAAEIDPGQVEARLKDGLNRLDYVLKAIAEINPQAQVIYIGLYNPFYDMKELRSASLQVMHWNDEAYRMVHANPGWMMVPTFDLFENTIGSYLSSDHFHPNHDGYTQIAQRVVQGIE
jgi:lysophospholipase L1-like esterase